MKRNKPAESARTTDERVDPLGNALACIVAPNHSKRIKLREHRLAELERKELRAKWGE